MALDPNKPLSQFTLNQWSTKDGLPQNSINAIAQTPDGYIWIGTQEGLVRYDGHRFVTLDKRNTLSFEVNFVQTLFVDHTGALWVAFEDAEVLRYDQGQWRRLETGETAIKDVQAIAEDVQGRMYFGTSNDGVWQLRWQNRTQLERPSASICRVQNGLSSNVVRTILPISAHTIVIGTAKGIDAIHWDDAPHIDSTTLPRLPLAVNGVFSTARTADSAIWATTDFGIFTLRHQQYKKIDYPTPISSGHIITDRHGVVWLGTVANGILRVGQDGQISGFPANHKVSTIHFSTVLEDREGNIWFGGDVGLYRLSETRFNSYTEESGLYNNITWAITEDAKKNIWIGTTYAVSRYMSAKGERIDVPLLFDALPNQRISARSIAFDRYGLLWTGTAIHGLFVFDPETRRVTHHFTKQNGLPDDGVRALHLSKNQRMWIGSRAGLQFTDHYSRGQAPKLFSVAELSGHAVVSLAEDSSGGIWVGTNGALFYVVVRAYEPLPVIEVMSYHINDGLPNPIIRSLHVDADHTVWVGTRGGLARSIASRGKLRFESFTVRDGLFDDAIFRILEDDQQRLWMSCNKGVFAIPKSQFERHIADRKHLLKPLVFGQNDGMQSEECNGANHPAGWKSQDGRLWFPTIKGVTVVDPRSVGNASALPPIVLERIMVDQRELDRSSEAVVDPYHARLTFEYTVPTFHAAGRVQFRYRLQGMDDHWIENQTRRSVEYSHLPPGQYALQVMAAYDETNWEQYQLLTIPIKVLPRFYQTYWFMILSFFTLVGLIGLGFRYRIIRLKHKANELQHKVNERTIELKDALRVAETARTAAEQANALKSQFLSIASHDMKTPLSNIVATTDLMGLDTYLTTEHKDDINNIQRSSFRMLNLINEMLEAVQLESQDIRLQVKQCDISHIVTELIAENIKSASRKNQRITLHAEPDMIAEVDGEKIREAFENYLSNAIKYSPHQAEIIVRLSKEDTRIRFSVTDQGPGISEENMGKLFQQFQRLGTKTTGGENSTGLGLFIVKLIAERHGGRVWAESRIGVGSTFFLEIPIQTK